MYIVQNDRFSFEEISNFMYNGLEFEAEMHHI